MRIVGVIVMISYFCFSQNRAYLHKVCNILCSKEFAGRAYTYYSSEKKETGIEKSRTFIIQEIRRIGGYDLMEYIEKSSHFNKKIKYNRFKFSGSIQPPNIEIKSNNIYSVSLGINDKKLVLGRDFLPDASCPSIDFYGELLKDDSVHYVNKEKGIVLKLENKLMYSSSQETGDRVILYVDKSVLDGSEESIRCDLKMKSKLETIKTDNIYAFIPGTLYPDSFIVLSAHYDHLGNIDTVYFPGANDNASGVAVLLEFMSHLKKNPLKYSVAFFFFTGEEIGLLGSKHYVEHPLFDLTRIKILLNMDLMGGGSDGMMVVNGKIFQKEYALLEEINKNKSFYLTIKSRGKAQNSDHYWFTEKGVKSFFIYTMGDIKAYHNIYDSADKLKFTNYEIFFQLITEWLKKL